MALVRPNALNEDTTPEQDDVLVIDGASVRKSTIVDVVNAARPFASQGEAEAGTATDVGMNPLATKQAIKALGLVPGDIGSTVQSSDPVLDSLAGLNLSTGDILYATGSSTLVRLPAGDEEDVLAIQSGVPAWRTSGVMDAQTVQGVEPGTTGLAVLESETPADASAVLGSVSMWGLLLPETQAIRNHWISEGVERPRSALLPLMDHTISRLIDEDIWDDLDVLYMPVHDETAWLTNWKDPGTYDGQLSGAPEFVALRGYQGDGDDAEIDTGFNPTTVGGQYAQEDAHIGVFCLSHISEDAALAGQASGDHRIEIVPRDASGDLVTRINGATEQANAVGTPFGWSVAARDGGTQQQWRDEAETDSDAITSAAPANSNIVLLTGESGTSSNLLGAAHIGRYLSDTKKEALHDILFEYMAELGTFNITDADAEALVEAMPIKPDFERKMLIDATVIALKEASLWDDLILFYTMASHDHMSGRMNWKNPIVGLPSDNPGNFLLPSQGPAGDDPPTHTADRGYTGDGVGAYLDTGWNLDHTDGPLDLRTDIACGAWARTDVAEEAPLFGTAIDSSTEYRVLVNPRNESDRYEFRIADETTGSDDAPGDDGTGLWAVNRSAADARQLYRNGVELDADTTAGLNLRSSNLLFLRAGNTSLDQYSTRQVSIGFLAHSLTAQKHEDMHKICRLWMAAVGAI